jgi:Holliday junction resolvase RusA-like endonuclease
MVERVKLVIPHRLPSLNEVIGANRGNKYAGAKLKKQTQTMIEHHIKLQDIGKFEKVRIDIDWYEPNKKRDFDNISSAKKFILDAMVSCGMIPNDGWKNLAPSFVECFYLDKDNPRVEVHITDMGE